MSNSDKFTKISYRNKKSRQNNNSGGRGRGRNTEEKNGRYNGRGRGRNNEERNGRYNNRGRGRNNEERNGRYNNRGRGRNSQRNRTDNIQNKTVEKKEIVPEEPKWERKPSPQGTWAALVRAQPKKVEETEENVDSE